MGEYEPATTAVIRAGLREGDTFIDVGANAGYFTLLAATLVGAAGRVIAFEPVPSVRIQLCCNIKLNDFLNCQVHGVAASNSDGECDIFVGPRDHMGVSSLRSLAGSSGSVKVELARLDRILAQESNIRVVKIDVEGAECHVIEGMRDILARFRPHLVLEITDDYLSQMGRSSHDIQQQVAPLGYEIFAIEQEGLRPLTHFSAYRRAQFNALLTTDVAAFGGLPILNR
jgi:FkbM family methyltransferase